MRRTFTHPRALAIPLALAALLACNSVESEPTSGDASAGHTPASRASVDPTIAALVAEIDELLAMPQDEYPDGSAVSGSFELLLERVLAEPNSLWKTEVSQSMGWFLARGHALGWNPEEDDFRVIAGHWRGFRERVLEGP